MRTNGAADTLFANRLCRNTSVMKNCPTLLITDDDHALRESLGSLFQASGFNTLMAANGREACEVVDCEDVHLVLIDYHMPFMTGLEALRTIKSSKRSIPVILMSAQLDDQMSEAAFAADAWSVHPKPLDISRIRGDVSSALQTIYNWSID